jgi:hypothetical protein
MGKIRSTLVTAAACGAAAVGGGAIANAATSSGSSSTASTTPSAPTAGGAPQGAAPGSGSYGPASSSGSYNSPPPGRAGFNPSQGGHTVNGKTEKLLTGDVAAKVRAAALAKVSGTVERVETNVDDSAPYEAHIVKSDGTQVIVEVNHDLTVHAVQSMGGHP